MKRFTLPRYKFLALLLLCLNFLIGCGSDKSAENKEAVTKVSAVANAHPAQTAAQTSEKYWLNVANTIRQQVNESLALANKGETKLATRKIGQAYFQQFEGSKMEVALRVQISPKHMLKVEKLFGDLRKSIKAEAKSAVLTQQAEAIIHAVTRDAKVLDAAGIQAELLQGM